MVVVASVVVVGDGVIVVVVLLNFIPCINSDQKFYGMCSCNVA